MSCATRGVHSSLSPDRQAVLSVRALRKYICNLKCMTTRSLSREGACFSHHLDLISKSSVFTPTCMFFFYFSTVVPAACSGGFQQELRGLCNFYTIVLRSSCPFSFFFSFLSRIVVIIWTHVTKSKHQFTRERGRENCVCRSGESCTPSSSPPPHQVISCIGNTHTFLPECCI